MNRVRTLSTILFAILTTSLSAIEYGHPILTEDLTNISEMSQDRRGALPAQYYYGNYGVLVGEVFLPDIGIGYRSRFESGWGFDIIGELHPYWTTVRFKVKSTFLCYWGRDPETSLGRTYVGWGPSADLIFFGGTGMNLVGMVAFSGNLMLGKEFAGADGSCRFLQLAVGGVGGPLPAASVTWGCQV